MPNEERRESHLQDGLDDLVETLADIGSQEADRTIKEQHVATKIQGAQEYETKFEPWSAIQNMREPRVLCHIRPIQKDGHAIEDHEGGQKEEGSQK
ncbi:hypothetical protein FRC00_004094 [Tulasnella sp. 408]|nr:hypothetical protein FRC00_004094 [Tulasnella sp. 408]